MRLHLGVLATSAFVLCMVAASPASAAGWGPTAALSPTVNTTLDAVPLDDPHIAMGGGWQTAAWRRLVGGAWRIEVRQRSPEGVWGPRLELHASYETFGAVVGMDGAGNAVVATCDADEVLVWDIPPGGQPEPTQSVPATRGCGGPGVAVDSAGNAVVTWQRFEQHGPDRVEASVRPAGGDWSEPAVVSVPTKESIWPAVGIDDGAATVAWIQRSAGRFQIAATRYVGAAWTPVTGLSRAVPYQPGNPVVSDDGLTVVWYDNDDPHSTLNVWSRRWAPTGWKPAVRLGHDAVEPDVASNASGETVVTYWYRQRSRVLLVTRRRPPTGSWSAPSVVATDVGNPFGFPVVGLADNGVATVAWNHQLGGNNPTGQCPLRVSRQPRGHRWGTPSRLVLRNNCLTVADIAAAPGTTTVVWQEQWSTASHEYGRIDARTIS